jgi:hypothetical protein
MIKKINYRNLFRIKLLNKPLLRVLLIVMCRQIRIKYLEGIQMRVICKNRAIYKGNASRRFCLIILRIIKI